jgi:phosphate:Na+ symporter
MFRLHNFYVRKQMKKIIIFWKIAILTYSNNSKGCESMDIFDLLTLVGGACLFLFGMSILGQALERRAGGRLKALLGKLTTNRLAGLATGLGITAVIQSSSATTVMVVGFVNSGLMTLTQAINVIMGANIGTTVTAWVLSLAGIDSGNLFVKLLKPSAFTPVLALIGIIFYMFIRDEKKKDTGLILLGFSTLMIGMETMSGAVSGLRSVPGFQSMFVMFSNPILGVAAGAILTAIIQSSSASVGILQALAVTGQVSYGAAIPIIMGQNIGTCVTAMLSSVGTNKNAKRAALVHLSFNVIGTAVWLAVFSVIRKVSAPPFLEEPASLLGIAVAHSVFNVLCTVLMLPLAGVLERLVKALVPDAALPETPVKLDERLLTAPAVAMERCREVAADMAQTAAASLKEGIASLSGHTPELAASVREKEEKTDHYEAMLGNYLVKLSARQISKADSGEAAGLLKVIGDFERIADHAVNLLESAEEMKQKGIKFTAEAGKELHRITSAVEEILDLSLAAFAENDAELAEKVEPLEQFIDEQKEQLRTWHIQRMQQGNCTMDAGYIWSDLLTNLERTADHCCNIAGAVMEGKE